MLWRSGWRSHRTRWSGVSNPVALKHLRSMAPGDRPLAAGIPMGVARLSEATENVRGIDTEDDLEQANERWSNLTAGWS